VEKARQQFETNCRVNGFQCNIRSTGGGPPGWFAVAMSGPKSSRQSPKVFLNGERGAASAVEAWGEAKQQCENEPETKCWVVLVFWKEISEREIESVGQPASRQGRVSEEEYPYPNNASIDAYKGIQIGRASCRERV